MTAQALGRAGQCYLAVATRNAGAYTRCPSSQSHRRSGRCPSSQSHWRSGHQFATLPTACGSGGGAWEIRVRGGRLAKLEGWVPAEQVARALRVPAELVARLHPSLHVERRPLRRRGTKTVSWFRVRAHPGPPRKSGSPAGTRRHRGLCMGVGQGLPARHHALPLRLPSVGRRLTLEHQVRSSSRGHVAILEFFDPGRNVEFLISEAEISCQSISATFPSPHFPRAAAALPQHGSDLPHAPCT